MQDEEIIDVARNWRNEIIAGDPALKCAMVCWPLAAYLESFCGVECECIESDLGECNHVWIRLADGRALDPTGDQFNHVLKQPMPDVYLGEPTTIHST